ncbi:chitobiase [Leptospira levettii]|uniref:chitobiase/beta-hexosaminidase C-terminal domain-containing protein n=1 Tax=Leptospira levettii TaxID=2023178 RepID=UPI000C29A9F1|nr:chitobiase/beta-hexosaminidase C-terminal domain-containing protein [Leptospira levettii]MCW7474741.1 chitobiase/beta-hexosaminidase C-terminal domain-containing protein [Leptospira levettii]PJZ39035.1 chitobiase [Leptospira levettii]PJZ87509.1 chitobiase [Leptospira levettii]PJZ98934.1 chitobiase [Leptospira levettii]
MRNKLYLLFVLTLFSSQCVGILPDGSSQQRFNPFLFLLGLIGGSPSSSQDLSPGTAFDLSGDGKTDATLVDSDGDGVSDGINLTGGTTPNLILLDTNGDGIPDAVDSNGDGIADYYISPNPPGFLTTAPGGTGNPVVIIVDANGNPLGFDTDGDGTPNDTAIVTILSDTTPPTLTSSLLAGTYSTAQTATLTCSDNRAPGSIVYTMDASSPTFSPKLGTVVNRSSQSISLSTEGNHTLQAICRDLAGNLSAPLNITYTIDSQVPALTLVGQTATAISSQAGAITSSTATWQSNRSGSYVIREGSDCASGTQVASGNVTASADQTFHRSHTNFTGEGTKTYRICVTGSNGLTGFVSFSLRRDDTPPTISASPGAGSYATATSVSASCSDVGGSGCDKIAYSVLVGSSPTNPSIQGSTGTIISGNLYNSALVMTDGATTYTKFIARDQAGNLSNVVSQTYIVDTEVSSITINSHTEFINGSSQASISWQSSKAGQYQIRIGGTNCTNGTALANAGFNFSVRGSIPAATSVTSSIENSHFAVGDNTIRICVENLVGSFGSNSRTTKKDTTAPVVTMTSPSGAGPFASGTQLQLSCSDTNGTGCEKIIYTLDGTDPLFESNGQVINGTVYTTPLALSDGGNQVKYLARDVAGNVSSAGNQNFHVGPPSAPTFVEAQAGGTSAIVQWWPVSGATSYTVYYNTSPGVTTASTSFGPMTDTYATITGLASGTLYYFRVVASNSGGNSSISLLEATALTTVTPPGTSSTGTYVDVSAGQGSGSGNFPSAIIDRRNNKLLIATTNQANSGRLSLFRCNLDGTSCTYHDISSSQGTNSGIRPSITIDEKNQTILVATTNGANNNKLALYRCSLEISECSYKDISSGQANESGWHPSIGIDYLNDKLIVVTQNNSNNSKPSLFRCDLNGNNCIHTDISADQGNGSGFSPHLSIDYSNQKLIVVMRSANKLSLRYCHLNGSNCIFRDIPIVGLENPFGVIDYSTNKYLIVANQTSIAKPLLIRCDMDGNNCGSVNFANLQSGNIGYYPNLVIDKVNEKLFISSIRKGTFLNSPNVWKCNLDGSSCTYLVFSSAYSDDSNLRTLLDTNSGKILIITNNVTNSNKPSLFIW